MNQRITELAQAATMDILGVPVLDQKRFAELIVRDCAGLCSIAAPGRDAEDIEKAILKHFGVES
jgi:hypothetical protein